MQEAAGAAGRLSVTARARPAFTRAEIAAAAKEAAERNLSVTLEKPGGLRLVIAPALDVKGDSGQGRGQPEPWT